MVYIKEFICLANSSKLGGACVAGKILDKAKIGGWIRPVSKRNGGELTHRERRYSDGSDPRLLDIIQVQFVEKQAHAYQSENHVIDDTMYWARIGRATKQQMEACVDAVSGPLWRNASSSTDGLNDRVIETQAPGSGSLRLVRVDKLVIQVAIEGAAFNNPRKAVRAQFGLNGHQYHLKITDPTLKQKYLAPSNKIAAGRQR
jgi:hypothetical protein